MKLKLATGIFVIVLVAGIGTVFALSALTNESTSQKNAINDDKSDENQGVKPTDDVGASKWMDSEVLKYVGDRKDKTKKLLEHSYRLIDAFIIGTANEFELGDFYLPAFEVERLLIADYEQFKSLYANELKTGKAVQEEVKKTGPLPWYKYPSQALMRIALKIDEAYRGAIDNVFWSIEESQSELDVPGIDEEKENGDIRERDGETRFMKARDVLQRYETWLFHGKFTVEGVMSVSSSSPDR